MRSTPLLPVVVAWAAAALALVAAPLRAQSDEQAIAQYRLTETAFAKFARASRNLVAAAKANPAALQDPDSDETAKTLADMAATYDRHPALKQAITSTGMTTREYATFALSMFQAGLAAAIVEQHLGTLDSVPAGAPRENVLFYQRHKAELDRITAELRALEGKQEADEPPDPGR